MNFQILDIIIVLKRMYKFGGKRQGKREGKAGQRGSTTGNTPID